MYVPTNSAFKVWKVTSLASGNTQFSITEDPSGAHRVSTFTWNTNDSGWTLNRSGVAQERKMVQTGLPAVGPREVSMSRRSETLESSTPGDSAVPARTTSTFATLSLGGVQRPDVLVEERVDGRRADGSAANPDQVTSYYYAATATTNGHEKMLRTLRSDGYWEHYDYSGDLVSKVYAPWLNSTPPTDIHTPPTSVPHKEIANDYTLLTGDAGTDLVTPRRTEVFGKDSAGGSLHLVSRSYVLFTNDNISYPRLYVRQDIACRDASATWNDQSNRVTVTRTYLGGPFKDAVRTIDRADGTRTVYSYSETTTEAREGAAGSGDTVTDGRYTRTTRTSRGYVQTNEVFDILTSKKLASSVWSVPGPTDPQGRFTLLTHLDGTTETYTYDCCSLVQVIDREGVTTGFTPDALKRIWKTTAYGIQSTNAFDANGNVAKTTRIGSSVTDVLPLRVYDRAGRVVSEQNALLGTTTTVESTNANGGRLVTTTYPDLGTRIEEYNRDGRLAKVQGTAVAPVQYDYELDSASGQLFTKETKLDTGGSPTSEWTKTYVDFLGHGYKTISADATAPESDNPYSQNFFKNNGQLWKQRDPDGVFTVYIFNTRGEVEYTMTGLANDPATPPSAPATSGNHRIKRAQTMVGTYVAGSTTNSTVLTRVTDWTTANSAATIVSSETHTSLDGLRQWSVSYPNDPLPQVVRTVTQYAGGTSTVTTTYPDSSSQVNVFTNGRLASVTRSAAGGSQISQIMFAYDGDGHLYTASDARNGAITYTYNNADLPTTVTTPVPASGQTAQVTTTRYNQMLQVTNVVQADSTSVFNEYHTNALLKKTYGSRTYPVEYTYDAQGRMRTMTTWQDFTGNTGTATTTWNYDAYRGFLTNKVYPGNQPGPGYTYTPGGRLRTRACARGILTTNSYTAAGDLQSVSYLNDPTGTPGVAFAYDRRGRLATLTQDAATETLAYDHAGNLLSDSYAGGLLNGLAVTNAYDSRLRRTALALNTQPSTLNQFGYDNASRLVAVTNGTSTATYGYLANSPLVGTVTFKQGATTRLTTTKQYDFVNRLTSLQNSSGGQPVAGFDSLYNPANQRLAVTNADGSRWVYAYDALGQVTSGKKYWADGTPVAGQQFEYQFDDIGNLRTNKFGGDNAGGNLRQAIYQPNSLNQFTNRTVPGFVSILGRAHSNATVTINNQPTSRRGDYFRGELSVNNSTGAVYLTLTNLAVLQQGTNPDIVTTNSGHVLLARTPETFGYDADGNLTNDGQFTYTWDAENRLTKVESLSTAPTASKRRVTWEYDALGRRVRQTTHNGSTGAYVVTEDLKFLNDGWRCLAELNATNNALVRAYVWGLDLSGTLGGAGGVGGLLMLSSAANGTHFYAYDGYGNVAALVKAADGTVSANYEYEPFGKVLRATGLMAKENRFQFSTKRCDPTTDFLLYEYRILRTDIAKWLSRDPIGELGELNLYAAFRNNALTYVDRDGRDNWSDPTSGQNAINHVSLPASSLDNPMLINISLTANLTIAVGANATWEGAVRATYDVAEKKPRAGIAKLVQEGHLTPQEGAKAYVEQRNDLIRNTRSRSSPVGRAWAEWLKPDRNFKTYEVLRQTKTDLQIIENAYTRPSVNSGAGIAKGAGKVCLVAGITLTFVDIYGAPLGERGRRVAGNVGGTVGALAVGYAGGKLGAAGGTAVAPGPGTLIGAGIGFIGGSIIGGIAGDKAGENYYDAIVGQ